MTTWNKITAATAAASAVSAALTGCSTAAPDTESSPSPSRPGAASSAPPAGTPSGEETTYADGDYRAVGEYGGQPSHITVALTLTDEVITSAEVTPHATNPTSLDYQNRFAEAVPALVVGRPINDVELSRVAGSSGTPEGFNDALEQIKADAST